MLKAVMNWEKGSGYRLHLSLNPKVNKIDVSWSLTALLVLFQVRKVQRSIFSISRSYLQSQNWLSEDLKNFAEKIKSSNMCCKLSCVTEQPWKAVMDIRFQAAQPPIFFPDFCLLPFVGGAADFGSFPVLYSLRYS
jgi:hypothetical protein